MLRVLGGPKRLCDGLTRRELLQVGSLGLLGLGLTEWQALTAARAGEPLPSARLPGFGQAKSCILLFLYGSPSQLETFDPKPDAPLEIRGEFGCISSSVAGAERLRPASPAVAGHGQGHGDPVGLASLPDPRGGVRDDGHPADRCRAGAQPPATRATGRSSARRSTTSTATGRTHRRPGGRRCPATWSCPGRSAVSGSARCRARARTADSWARRMTRSAPSSSARRRRSPARPWPARSGKTSSPIGGSRRRAGSSSARSPTWART